MAEERLALLLRLIERLRHYAATLQPGILERDLDKLLMVSRALELAAQCCIDLAVGIAASRGLPAATTYRETFTRLAEAGVVDRDLAARMEGWAGLRNVLAHLYTRLDIVEIERAMREDVGTLEDFARVAARVVLDAETGDAG